MRFRTKETAEAMDGAHAALRLDDPQRRSAGIARVLGAGAPRCPHFRVEPHVVQDAHLLPWLQRQPQSCVGRAWLTHLLHHPCTDAGVLHARAAARLPPPAAAALHDLHALEADALWALTLPDLKTTWPMPFLFPTWPLLRTLNRLPLLLEAFHAYRLWFAPAMQVLYPVLLLLGPYLFLRRKLGWKLSLGDYLKLALMLFKTAIQSGGRHAAGPLLSLAFYVGLYLYGVVQMIDMARMVHAFRRTLRQRLRNLRRFYEGVRAAAEDLVAAPFGFGDLAPLPPWRASGTIQGIYAVWTNARLQENLAQALRWLAVLDILAAKERLLRQLGHTPVDWTAASSRGASSLGPPVRLWGMAHPALEASVRNPACLARHLVVTGPNAAGKTTYLRGILANVLLAQTLGVARASRAQMAPHVGIATFMRLGDETGRASLFEAEVERCLAMWRAVEAGPKGPFLLVLDEPMHATPPVEGAAAAMAFLKLVGGVPGVRVLATTHYHALTELARDAAVAFANVSMEARLAADGGIAFPYRLRAGPSFQCIALELLRERHFPAAFVEDAIEIKNKLSRQSVTRAE